MNEPIIYAVVSNFEVDRFLIGCYLTKEKAEHFLWVYMNEEVGSPDFNYYESNNEIEWIDEGRRCFARIESVKLNPYDMNGHNLLYKN